MRVEGEFSTERSIETTIYWRHSNGVALYLQTILGEKSLLLLSVGASDDGPHGPNEKIDRRNYIEGTKLFGAYRHYFAEKT